MPMLVFKIRNFSFIVLSTNKTNLWRLTMFKVEILFLKLNSKSQAGTKS